MSGWSSASSRTRSDFHLVPALLAGAWAAGIWWLSARSFDPLVGAGWFERFLSNYFHFPLFGGLTVLAAEALRGADGLTRRRRLAVVAGVVLYGVVDELHQGRTPGRTPDPADVLTDLFAAVGFVVAWGGLRGGAPRGPALLSFALIGLLAALAVAVQITR